MQAVDRLAELLGGELGAAVHRHWNDLAELRLRIGRPTYLRLLDGKELKQVPMEAQELHRILSRLMDNSMYACESELQQGYFTASGGLRVGVCGRLSARSGAVESLSSIASACIRIPREVCGCAAKLAAYLLDEPCGGALILSPPGLGKTTLLRDLARLASESGLNVAIADERRELAACWEGIPQLDLGPRTDVMDGCPKAISIPLLVRACAPDLLAVDEIGSAADGEALLDAARCGVRIAATAHARSFADAAKRPVIARLFATGVFAHCALLGPLPGQIQTIQEVKGC